MSKRQINYDTDKQLTAQRLREAMADAEISASELAEKSKVSKSSISQYYNAYQSPSNLSAMAMAKVLGVNPVWLMGFDEPKKKSMVNNVSMSISHDEQVMLEQFRCLDVKIQKVIRSSIQSAYDDYLDEKKEISIS